MSVVIFCSMINPNLPTSHILFHKNGSLRDFYIMTLYSDIHIPPKIVLTYCEKIASVIGSSGQKIERFLLREHDQISLYCHKSSESKALTRFSKIRSFNVIIYDEPNFLISLAAQQN